MEAMRTPDCPSHAPPPQAGFAGPSPSRRPAGASRAAWGGHGTASSGFQMSLAWTRPPLPCHRKGWPVPREPA
jgi:hypothetical protein